MKNSILNNLLITSMLLSVLLLSCEEKVDMSAEEITLSSIEEAPVVNSITKAPKVIATVQRGHNQIEFSTIGPENDIVMIEKFDGQATESILEQYDKANPIEIFMALTSKDDAIPELLLSDEDTPLIKASLRDIDGSGKPLMLMDSDFEGVSTETCTGMDAMAFLTIHCESPVVSTPDNIEFCDNGYWTALKRSSYFGGWRAVNYVRTVTNVICGTVRIQFEEFKDGSWQLYHQVEFTTGTSSIRIWTRRNRPKRYRRVKRSAIGSNAKFRAFTRFYNP